VVTVVRSGSRRCYQRGPSPVGQFECRWPTGSSAVKVLQQIE
jgi:hypothetical protein